MNIYIYGIWGRWAISYCSLQTKWLPMRFYACALDPAPPPAEADTRVYVDAHI